MASTRWSIHKAAQEFGIHRETLGKKLEAQSIRPGKDKAYSTSDICKAIFGDLDGERLLLIREQREKLSREREKDERQLIPSELVERVWCATMIEFRQRVMVCDLPRQQKEELLEILTEPKIDEYFAAAIKELSSDSAEVNGAE